MTHHHDDRHDDHHGGCGKGDKNGGHEQPTRDGIVSGTSGSDFIDVSYTGDPDGDRIDHNDAIFGNVGSNDDSVEAGWGDDTVLAGDGNDTVHGDNGLDSLDGGDGNDVLYGEADDDTVIGGAGDDTLYGNSGDDSIEGGSGNDEIQAGTGGDFAAGGAGDDLIDGDTGQDTLMGGAGSDTLDGGGNDDLISGGDDADTIDGGGGDDTICGGAGDDSIAAGAGADLVYGGAGADAIQGGAGNDTLVGGPGDDSIDGGDGDDLIYGDGGTCADNTVTITFDGDVTAAYLNSIGLYEIDLATGAISNVQMAWENASAEGSGGDLQPGVSSYSFHVTPGAQVGLFMVSDGDSQNDYAALGDGHLEFVSASGDEATVHDSAPQLVFVGDDGTTTPIQGGTFHSAGYGADQGLNSDGDQHLADGGMEADGSVNISIEDMVNLGDRDFNDAQINVACGAGVGFANPFHDITGTVVEGGSGNSDDSLMGGAGDDTIFGGTGNDTIDAGAGVNEAFGGDDRDTFVDVHAGDWVDGNEGGDDFDTLDLTGAGPLSVAYDPSNPENGTVTFYSDTDKTHVAGSMEFRNIENVVPCFTPGTLIATPRGERLVEELRPGDKVITRDNGIQEIRWVGQKVLDWKELSANSHLKPILVRAGSLGNGLPERDMMVSPNHRLLVANDRTALYFDEHEVLVAAKHVVNNTGIHSVDTMGTTYIHFMFDHHEVVLSNGAWTESFQPGDYTLQGMGNSQRNEIYELFPELKTPAGVKGYTAARKTLKRHEAALLRR